ncbi:MAG: hypothetical protein ABIJ86_15065 [Spirochaetota bacterium]
MARDNILSIQLPGIGTINERIGVSAGGETKVPGLVPFALDALKRQQARRRAMDKGGWVSFGFGVLGAVGAGASYFPGSSAMQSYEQATVTTDITAAR